jgi:hypothetical protein
MIFETSVKGEATGKFILWFIMTLPASREEYTFVGVCCSLAMARAFCSS